MSCIRGKQTLINDLRGPSASTLLKEAVDLCGPCTWCGIEVAGAMSFIHPALVYGPESWQGPPAPQPPPHNDLSIQ